jgi:hypothetical protein
MHSIASRHFSKSSFVIKRPGPYHSDGRSLCCFAFYVSWPLMRISVNLRQLSSPWDLGSKSRGKPLWINQTTSLGTHHLDYYLHCFIYEFQTALTYRFVYFEMCLKSVVQYFICLISMIQLISVHPNCPLSGSIHPVTICFTYVVVKCQCVFPRSHMIVDTP